MENGQPEESQNDSEHDAKGFSDSLKQLWSDTKKQAETFKFWLELAGFFALVFYALLTLGILCSSKKSADAATKAATTAQNTLAEMKRENTHAEQEANTTLQATINQFHLEQRAWVGFTWEQSNTVEQGIHHITLDVIIANSGKTPAKDVAAQSIVLDWSRYAPPPTWQQAESRGRVPLKREMSRITKELKTKGIPLPPQSPLNLVKHVVLAPNVSQTMRVINNSVSSSELSRQTPNRVEYVLVRVTYSDVFARSHVTDVCIVYRDFIAPPESCATGNDMN